MPRATRTPATRKRKKKFLKRAKGFWGGRHRLYRTARETVQRALAFATRDRRKKKRAFRNLWVIRINAACRKNGMKYSTFMAGLKRAKVTLDRKSLAEIAVRDGNAFKELVQLAKKPR
ncbi:MAG: 50S ribosomal protein L20 [Candidatus Omnitrophica bacterium]|nr:50S ribosomal protein L20 [Candidatus Omnitrophota bacterium]